MCEWIRCEDRLPEPNESAIVWGPVEGVVGPVELGESVYGPCWFSGIVNWDCYVFTHWMPLPELPKEPSDE